MKKRRLKPILALVITIIAMIIAPTKITSLLEDYITNPAGTDSTTSGQTESTSPLTTESPEEAAFQIHFIDVGQADAALVLCDGRAMLIDGGNTDDSSLIYSYLKNHEVSHLDYIVASHAHEDHVGGLSGALNYADADILYCPTDTYDSAAFSNLLKAAEKQDLDITVPKPGEHFFLGSAVIDILACNSGSETNDTSIVLKITYGNTSFLFTGDAERETEQVILDAGIDLSSTVLKVGHHGSEDSSTYPFLREVMPKYAVISVGADNLYGHPTENVLSRLRDADVTVYRTDLQGTIICTSDGNGVHFTASKHVP